MVSESFTETRIADCRNDAFDVAPLHPNITTCVSCKKEWRAGISGKDGKFIGRLAKGFA
jgi:hypothetical protein